MFINQDLWQTDLQPIILIHVSFNWVLAQLVNFITSQVLYGEHTAIKLAWA